VITFTVAEKVVTTRQTIPQYPRKMQSYLLAPYSVYSINTKRIMYTAA